MGGLPHRVPQPRRRSAYHRAALEEPMRICAYRTVRPFRQTVKVDRFRIADHTLWVHESAAPCWRACRRNLSALKSPSLRSVSRRGIYLDFETVYIGSPDRDLGGGKPLRHSRKVTFGRGNLQNGQSVATGLDRTLECSTGVDIHA